MGTYGHITQEIKATVENFLNIEFVYERRESNTEANNLARSAIYDSSSRHVWLVTPPVDVCT
jgi:nitrate reductase NapAB chaperone NapD